MALTGSGDLTGAAAGSKPDPQAGKKTRPKKSKEDLKQTPISNRLIYRTIRTPL
jgi:hypothetical protein